MESKTSSGGCACGAVRFTVTGPPIRAGLCHCMTCRKSHAAAFSPFVVFARDQVEFRGEIQSWQSSQHYQRSFCPACGSRVFGSDMDSHEVELSSGSFDTPGLFQPSYESWVSRREPWLMALPVPQHHQDRPSDWRQSTFGPSSETAQPAEGDR